MLVVLSPAKRLDFSAEAPTTHFSKPIFLKETKILVDELRKKTAGELSDLMGISENLAQENALRYSQVKFPLNLNNSKQAIFAFRGDTYLGLGPETFLEEDLIFSQLKLRILSGLFGILSPLDLIFPYRLEMGTKFGIGNHRDLYGYWSEKVTANFNELDNSYLLNCASEEYFSVIDLKKLKAKVITPVFLDREKGTKDKFKNIGIFAKQARGMMASFMIKERIKDPEKIKDFNLAGYAFDAKESKNEKLIFKREYKRKS
jgi:uncharacterized protein